MYKLLKKSITILLTFLMILVLNLGFKAYALEGESDIRIRLPIFNIDREIVGFGKENSHIQLKIKEYIGPDVLAEENLGGGEENFRTVLEKPVTTDENGFFIFDNLELKKGYNIEITGESTGEKTALHEVLEHTQEKRVINDNVLLRDFTSDTDILLSSPMEEMSFDTIGELAYYNKNLRSVKLADGIKNISTAAFYKNQISELELSSDIEKIGKLAFKDNQIKSVSFGKFLFNIEEEAFMNNKLASIEFEKSDLAKLEKRVFAKNELTSIKLPDNIKSVEESAFEDNRKILKLITDEEGIVPTNTYDVERSNGDILSLDEQRAKKAGNTEKTNQANKSDNTQTNTTNSSSLGNNNNSLTSGSTSLKTNNSSSNSFSRGGGGGGGSSRGGGGGGAGIAKSKANSKNNFLPKNYKGSTKELYGNLVPSNVQKDNWKYDKQTKTWNLVDDKGNAYKNTWALVYIQNPDKNVLKLPYAWFKFDNNSKMQTGWINENNAWFYLNPNKDKYEGIMLLGWQKIDNKWYYFEKEFGPTMGKMYADQKTPDGYYVDKSGVWIQ